MQNNNTKDLSDLELFWQNENEKLIAYDGFSDDLGNLFDDKLNFTHSSGKSVLDFSVFDLDHICIASPAILTLNGKRHTLTLKEYAKLLVINNISPLNLRNAISIYGVIKNVAAFLNFEQERMLTPENIESFHVSFLTRVVTENRWASRLSPPAFRATYGALNFQNAQRILYSLGVEGFFDVRLTKKHIDKTLDNACRSVIAISCAEYKQGGSFNFLSLDMGQYYIDHLKRVYEKDHLFALVCQSAIKTLISQEGYENSALRPTYICEIILGTFDRVNKSNATFSRSNIHKFLNLELFRQYQNHFDKVQSVRLDNIIEVVSALGLNLRFDAIEVVRVLMLQRFYSFSANKTASDVWRDYQLSLGKTEISKNDHNDYTVDDVYKIMENVVAKHKLDKSEFDRSLKKWAKGLMNNKSDVTFKELKAQLDRVSHAMTSLIVAYTGFRKSEFGFPFSAISVHQNLDILDSAHVPFRFVLKWIVPKTCGTTKITREITSQCYLLAAQLKEVLFVPDDAPCLYIDYNKIASGKKTPHESERYIDRRVQLNWEHFVYFYQPFVDIRELERLSTLHIVALSEIEQVRFKHLSKQYDFSSARCTHLLAAKNEVQEGLRRLKACYFAGNKFKKHFKKSLIEYQKTGFITDEHHREIFTEYLSKDTQQWLRSESCHLNLKAMIDIGNEVTLDVRYPTAHAFRHIWAESVLMRYQGDIGAVVQHQFCHLDPSFFMAYLRNKEAKHLMQAARMKVLNSIVDILLCDTDKIGKEYVGGFSFFVKKAASLVEAVTDNEVRALRDRIAGRVISIQPSRFATCVPREGAESRAKCAEMGEINPHNAKPSFCLGCTNAIITSGNIAGIWATIQPFVKECLNDDIMGFMVESHLDTLHSANRRIKELAPSVKNSSSMDKILFYINEAIKSVERKLEAEKGLYE